MAEVVAAASLPVAVPQVPQEAQVMRTGALVVVLGVAVVLPLQARALVVGVASPQGVSVGQRQEESPSFAAHDALCHLLGLPVAHGRSFGPPDSVRPWPLSGQ